MSLIGKVLFVAWRSPQTRTIHPVGRLLARRRGGAVGWEFAYLHGARAAAADGFTAFPDFPDLTAVYDSLELPPLFENRVMPATRADFLEHFRRLNLLPEQASEPILILARTGGLRPTDQIEVFGLPSYDAASGSLVYRFFLRGVRHIDGAEERIRTLRAEAELLLRPEPENPHDPLAVAVDARTGKPVGYVPHCLVDDLRELREQGSRPQAFVERINPEPAPVHERLLVRLVAPLLQGFVPFSSPRYQPIAEAAEHLEITTASLAA